MLNPATIAMDIVQAVLPSNHFHPHRSAKFEGYYSKFNLPSGARLITVICTIPNAPGRKHYVALIYVSRDGSNIWRREYFPQDIKVATSEDGFSIAAVDMLGRITASSDAVRYDIGSDEIAFSAISSERTPWSKSWFDTPAGPLAWLPLPLHWHVHSLASQCSFSLSLPSDAKLAKEDQGGNAIVHEEKNWANSFPSAHNWLQGRNHDSSICLAGGRTMGLDAFLVGYRHKGLNIELDYRPPFALKAMGISPFMKHDLSWESRTFFLSVQNFSHKLEVLAVGKKGTFLGLASPMSRGFKDNYMGQSHNAEVQVKIYKSTGLIFGGWQHVHTDNFADAALEFGASYYPPRGTVQAVN